MGRSPMPSILLDHIAIALPRIADAPSVLVAVVGAPSGAPDDIPPPGLPGASPSVRILGLRMRAHSRKRALTQWRDILQAEIEEGSGGGLTFRWPGSPMRILVEVDPTAA